MKRILLLLHLIPGIGDVLSHATERAFAVEGDERFMCVKGLSSVQILTALTRKFIVKTTKWISR
jgi:hypothetical protein